MFKIHILTRIYERAKANDYRPNEVQNVRQDGIHCCGLAPDFLKDIEPTGLYDEVYVLTYQHIIDPERE